MRLRRFISDLDCGVIRGQDRVEAIKRLLNRFSLAEASILIKNNLYCKTDYMNLKDELFDSKSVEDLYNEMQSRT